MFALVALLIAASVGCASERAVRVTFEVAAPLDTLCVLAGDGTNQDVVGRYAASDLPMPATLTFVAGSPSRLDAVVGAFALAGGRVSGSGHLAMDLRIATTLERDLLIGDCRPGSPTGLGLSPSGTFAVLAATSRLSAADFDGDGRDELLAIAADGSLAMLNADDPDAGSRRVSELSTTGGFVVDSGDLDADCRLDLIAVANSGVLRVFGEGGRSAPPIGPPDARGATIVELILNAGPLVVGASSDGVLMFNPADGSMIGALSGELASFVVAADLDGDGIGDLVAGGSGTTTRLYHGATDAIREEPGAGAGLLATAVGPAAAGDLDGDGREEVVLGLGTGLRVLTFGGGSLEEISVPGTFTNITRVQVGDLDGDCIDDLVVLDASTARLFFGRTSARTMALREGPSAGAVASDVALGDVDGDGAREGGVARRWGTGDLVAAVTRLVMCLVVWMPGFALAQGGPSARIDEGRAAYESLDYEAAVEALTEALRSPSIVPTERARALETLAFALVVLDRERDAEARLHELFALDAYYDVREPTGSPRILAFVERVRRDAAADAALEPGMAVRLEVPRTARADRDIPVRVQVTGEGSTSVSRVILLHRGETDTDWSRTEALREGSGFAAALPALGRSERLEIYAEARDARGRLLGRSAGPLAPTFLDVAPAASGVGGGEDALTSWWLWTIVGVVVVGAAVGIGVGVASTPGEAPAGTLPPGRVILP